MSLSHNKFLTRRCQVSVFLLSESLVKMPGTFHLLVLRKTIKFLKAQLEKCVLSQPYYKIPTLTLMGIQIRHFCRLTCLH